MTCLGLVAGPGLVTSLRLVTTLSPLSGLVDSLSPLTGPVRMACFRRLMFGPALGPVGLETDNHQGIMLIHGQVSGQIMNQ